MESVSLPSAGPRSAQLTFRFAGTDDISDSLVPGDVVDISDPSLNTFPADLVLLSGDAIVNESMLTGESVPVSKYPVEQAEIELISAPGAEVSAELSRHVVFSGTKIIRIRKTSPPGIGGEAEAIAMVMRTGELKFEARLDSCADRTVQVSTLPRERS